MRTLYPLLLLLLTGRMLLAQCITYTYDSMGNRTARVIAGGCDTACDYAVAASTSNANPAANASITLSASCSGSACSGVSYQWSGNGLNQGGQSVTLNAPGASGSYTYTVTASKSGCSNKTATVTVTVGSPPGNCGTGTGLLATYYGGQTLGGSPIATLTQGPIDFTGGEGQTIAGTSVAASNISARWEGQVEAPATGSYTFNMRTDDGVRVWFNNTQVVDDFGDYAPTDHNFTVSLTAGQKYNIRMEWKQGGGGYEARLFWTYPGQATQIVPACRLYPVIGGNCTPATGYATLRRWTGVTGSTLADLSSQTNGYTSSPSSTTNLSELRTQTGWGDNYGQQVQGYITAPLSGSYTFWIASDDNSELWLSSGENPASMQRIAWVSDWTNPEVWNQFPSQKSAPVTLAACQRYYFEIRHKEGGGGDNLAVGWARPGEGTSSPSEVVPGSVLSPYSSCTPPAAPSLSASSPSIVSGQSSTLTASNCAGTVTWGNGLGTGSTKSVSPTSTTTYTATCTVSGCTSPSSSVTVTVGGGNGSCVVDNLRLKFRVCCFERLVGATIQGSSDQSNWTTFYTFTTQGTGEWQSFALGNTTPYRYVRFVASPNGAGELVELEFYSGTTKLSGTVFGSPGTLDNNPAYGYANAMDGVDGQIWHGLNLGTENFVGLDLAGCSGNPCTPPAPPSLSASQATVNSGQSTTLTATGCAGTVTWGNGLGTGSTKSVSPTSTTTYTATCTVNGCTSGSASVTVTVGGGGGGGNGCVVDNLRLKFRDCCFHRLVGATIQGSSDQSNWTTFYTFNQEATGSWQSFALGNTTPYRYVRFVASPNGAGELVELEFYSGTTKLSGTVFGSPGTLDNNPAYGYANAMDGVEGQMWHGTDLGTQNYVGLDLAGCSGNPCTPPAPPSLSASQATVNSGQSSTLTASNCAGTVTWDNVLGTGSTKSVSPTSTTTYTATCTVNGCTSGSASVTVTVGGGGGGGNGCVVDNLRLKFRDCCFHRLVGATIQGSSDQSNWTTFYTFNQEATGSWQSFALGNTTPYRYVRFVASPNGAGELVELEFYSGTTKLSGTVFGSPGTFANDPAYGYANAMDGVEGQMWHGTDLGTQNYVGLDLAGCSGARIGIAEASTEENQELRVSPNPNNGQFEASFYVEPGFRARLSVSDMQGREVWQKVLQGEGQHREPVIIPGVSIGMYIVSLWKEGYPSQHGQSNSIKIEHKKVIVVK